MCGFADPMGLASDCAVLQAVALVVPGKPTL